jgi:organic radical activating enzyme
MNNSFCVMLWNNVSVDPDGSVKPCCISKDYIKKPDGTKYNIGYDKIEDFYNSPDYVNIREKMLKGETVPGCSQCTQLESYGKESKRILTRKLHPVQTVKMYREGKTIVNTDIEYFDLRFGNLCNLKCRSCMPLNSTQLDKQVQEHPELSKFYHNYNYDINEWYETEIYEENVYSNLKHMKTLYITGGEPTLIKKNFELLEKLIDEGYNKNITIYINSNMTNDKTNFFDLLSQFKRVLFFASIDGYGKIQEYLRSPSYWDQISKNFKRLVDRNSENISIRASPVIQSINLGNIVDLFEYCEEFNRQHGKLRVEIFMNILENPSYLNLVNLPLDYKIKCWNKIDEWVKTKCQYQGPLFHSQLETLKNKCFAEVDYQQQLDTFFEFNLLLDTHQKSSLEEVNPELYALMNK